MKKRRFQCSAPREISEYFPLLRPIKRQVILAMLLGVLLPLLNASLLVCLAKITDSVLSTDGGVDTGTIGLSAVLCGALAILKAQVNYLDRLLDTNVVERISQRVRQDIFDHSLALSPGSLQGGASQVPDLVSRMGVDSERIAALIYGIPMGILTDSCAALSIVGFLVLTSWKLTVVGIALLPMVYSIIAQGGKRVRAASNFARRRYSGWMNLADVVMNHSEFVSLSGARGHESSRFARRCNGARAAELLATKAQATVELRLELLMVLGGAAVLVVAIGEIRAGRMSAGAVVSFLAALHLLCSPIKSLGQASTRFQRATASAQRVREILQTKNLVFERVPPNSGISNNGDTGPLSPEAAKELLHQQANAGEVILALESVSFAYPGRSKQVLKDLSLEIVEGRVTAVVGINGSGKSTLAKLLLRLYDPCSGRVNLRSVDLKAYSLHEIRSRVGIMLQDTPLVLGSVADNIRYGVDGCRQADIETVARTVGLHSTICALPRGYKTIIGGSVQVLSRGIQQRLGLARLLLRGPEVLILDEATASMDGENEELVAQLVSSLKGKHTILVIAHRIASVRNADYVYVLEDGEIAERGAPTMLLQAGKRCHSLFSSQMIQSSTLDIVDVCP